MAYRMQKRRNARINAIQMMYQIDIKNESPNNIIVKHWPAEEKEIDKKSKIFAEDLFVKTFENRDKIDCIIKKYLKETWQIDRLGFIDVNILRVAISEFLYFDTPIYAILDEYVTIASIYSDEKNTSFINALLDKFSGEYNTENDRKN
jgi:N utilization substance protein B